MARLQQLYLAWDRLPRILPPLMGLLLLLHLMAQMQISMGGSALEVRCLFRQQITVLYVLCARIWSRC